MIFPLALLLQTVSSTAADELVGPPHEELWRAREHIGAVLCRVPNHRQLQEKVEAEFGARVARVQQKVEAEYGQALANASYITTVPCYRFTSENRLALALKRAKQAFDLELRRWEARYRLPSPRLRN